MGQIWLTAFRRPMNGCGPQGVHGDADHLVSKKLLDGVQCSYTMAFEKLVFRVHVIQRMFQRGIAEENVRKVLEEEKVVEQYPEDHPFPSYLMLGFCGERPIHVVAADNEDRQETIVITAYEPDPSEWNASFTQRKT